MTPRFQVSTGPIDLEDIAQRIIALAEIATVDHLEMLMNSQAEAMFKLACETDAA